MLVWAVKSQERTVKPGCQEEITEISIRHILVYGDTNMEGHPNYSHAFPGSEAGGSSLLPPHWRTVVSFSTLHCPGSYPLILTTNFTHNWCDLITALKKLVFTSFWLGEHLTSGTDLPLPVACSKGSLWQLPSPKASSFDSLGDLTPILESSFFSHSLFH